MRVLVLGPGGREHALARALRRDPAVTDLHCGPGNPGTAAVATNHQIDPTDPAAVVELAGRLGVDLVVVGPEAVLVAGVGDALRAAGIACFGPDAEAARIEGSKAFAKDVMRAAGVPTADAQVCDSMVDVEAALDAYGPPYVVKDDGLAAGKGVVVTSDRAAALAHAAACDRVVVEAYLDGPEVSLFALCDGVSAVPLLPAQDFKRALDGDEGPNTGGMGAYTPLPWAPAGLVDEVMATVVRPTLDELRSRGTPYVGVLYAGLALTSAGVRVVEFNARFGDPETQVVLDRLATPLGGLLQACALGVLDPSAALEWTPGAAVTVVVAAEDYPAAPVKGDVIAGVAEADAVAGAYVLHAGTALDGEGLLVANGGRVLNVVGTGADVAEARAAAYAALAKLKMRGGHYRTDIAAQADGAALA
ncbi:phosphoribosylamine--glycine ligase [Actinomadura rubteroloni]|uniref:phosphoribosylamine--glycine ligase n=1 Tax=Actinomadura rubteroloni TaxID=1926885 RepID=UPI000CD7F1CE|nr:phosphoribosylamine--glycine ligase [Actinomadura rubteroloni]